MRRLIQIAFAFLAFSSLAFGQAIGPQWFVVDTIGQDYLGQVSAWKPGNVAVSNGLTITDKLETVQAGNAIKPQTTVNYTTGMLAANSYYFTYGDIDYIASFPQAAKGVWSILFLLGQDCALATKLSSEDSGVLGCNWPAAGSDEIDLSEILYNSSANNINEQIHTGSHNDVCNPTITDITAANHFEILWAVGSLQFWINSVLECTIAAAYVPSTPMQLIIWSAVHTSPSATFPQIMTVQHVRVCATSAVGNCTQANTALAMNSSTGIGFDEEFTGTGPLSSVYVAQTFQGNATGLDAADAFGILNNQHPSWLQDAGYFSNGQIGPGTQINLVGSITSRPTANGSGTSGSPINFNFQSGASGSCPNPNGFNFIGVTGQNCNTRAGTWNIAEDSSFARN